MNWENVFFGHGTHLNVLQMSCRAVIAFFVTLVLLRIAGVRTFGKRSAFDNVIVIMLGSILSRAVVGASPFVPTSAACLVFVCVHWALAKLSFYSSLAGFIVKGRKMNLYAEGRQNKQNMLRSTISENDMREAIRLRLCDESMDQVDKVILERSGDISIIKKGEGSDARTSM